MKKRRIGCIALYILIPFLATILRFVRGDYPPRACEEIFEKTLTSFPASETSPSKLKSWIVKNYGIEPEFAIWHDGIKRYRWQAVVNYDVDKSYQIELLHDHSLFSYQFIHASPTVNDLIRCSSPPIWYRAKYTADPVNPGSVIANLVFTQTSASAWADTWPVGQPSLRFQGGTVIDVIEVMTSTSVLNRRYYTFDLGPLRPWPNREEDIMVDKK